VWCGPCYTPHPLDKFYQHRPSDEAGFEWRPKADATRHRVARPGDHLMVPFQCDLCSFRNICHRNPDAACPQDAFLLCCICRANLDAVWGREPNTVNATLRGVRQLVSLWRVAHIPVELPARGPFLVGDSLGLRVAVGMLIKSLEPGRYSKTYQQFETIRKLRAAFSNLHMSSLEGINSLRTVGGESTKMCLSLLPTNSLWFERFAEGCLKRMGQDVRQDWALPLPVLHAMLDILEMEWEKADCWEDRHRTACAGAFSMVAFCGSFRGNEIFLTDLFGLSKYLAELEHESFVIVPLLGRYKGESHHRYHLTPMAARSDSGLEVRTWIKRLIRVQHEVSRSHGPAFGNKYGETLDSSFIEDIVSDRLQVVKDSRPGLIPQEVDCYSQFVISRSYRRGATSTAKVRGVDKDTVNLVNRWRKFENAKGRQPRLSMQDHYSDIQILVPELTKFSQAL
jgi:hypothetical protein